MLVQDGSEEENPAKRLVLGSPVLTLIKYNSEDNFVPHRNKRKLVMPESPLFIPKTKSLTRMESAAVRLSSSIEERNSEPYKSSTSITRAKNPDPYENVVITSYPYTCTYNNRPEQYYKYTPKCADHYQNMDHVVYQQSPYHSYYPQNQYIKYYPQRTVPPPPTQQYMPPTYPAPNGRQCQSLSRIEMPRKSPGFDTTSGYSSYDQKTMSLNRGPPIIPTNMYDDMDRGGGIQHPPVPTCHKTHPKLLMDKKIFKNYFCMALVACIMCPPCGYWSLYRAFKVDDLIDSGNHTEAEQLAKKIKRYSIIMFCVGLCWICMAIGVFIFLLHKSNK